MPLHPNATLTVELRVGHNWNPSTREWTGTPHILVLFGPHTVGRIPVPEEQSATWSHLSDEALEPHLAEIVADWLADKLFNEAPV